MSPQPSENTARPQDGMALFKDRYEATFVVSPDPAQGDFTTLPDALHALPPTGGKIFVKAGTYQLPNTVLITNSNISIQGEGMGITTFYTPSNVTGDTPAFEDYDQTFGNPRKLLADTARGDTSIKLAPASFDTHEPAENVTFIGCAADGGVPGLDVAVGFQMRARNAAIPTAGANNDLVISNNIIENVNLLVPGHALEVSSGSRILISGNNLVGSSKPVSAVADAVIVNNPGINPVGHVPIPGRLQVGDRRDDIHYLWRDAYYRRLCRLDRCAS